MGKVGGFSVAGYQRVFLVFSGRYLCEEHWDHPGSLRASVLLFSLLEDMAVCVVRLVKHVFCWFSYKFCVMWNQIGIVISLTTPLVQIAFSFLVDRCYLYRLLRFVFCCFTHPFSRLVGRFKLCRVGVFQPGLSVAAAAGPAALSGACRRGLVWPGAPGSAVAAVAWAGSFAAPAALATRGAPRAVHIHSPTVLHSVY